MEEKSFENFIYGKNSVYETLAKNPMRVNKIYFQDGVNFDNRMKKIKGLAEKNSIAICFKKLNISKFPQNINHQGVIAEVSPIKYMELDEFLDKMDKKDGYKRIFILDNIQDPHNLGAIIRTIACSNFDGVIIPNHRGCLVNSTVEKTSSGATNHVNIIKVNSLSGAIDVLKKRDWWIIGTKAGAMNNYFEIDYTDMNFAVILGNEGDGISKTLIKKCDFEVKLKTFFESLNVSATCAVICYEANRQMFVKNSKKQ